MDNTFWFGVFGGAIPEFYALYKIREDFTSDKPKWVNSVFYWVITLGMIFLGGCVALIYQKSGTVVPPILAIHIGVATPTIIGNFIKEKPKIPAA